MGLDLSTGSPKDRETRKEEHRFYHHRGNGAVKRKHPSSSNVVPQQRANVELSPHEFQASALDDRDLNEVYQRRRANSNRPYPEEGDTPQFSSGDEHEAQSFLDGGCARESNDNSSGAQHYSSGDEHLFQEERSCGDNSQPSSHPPDGFVTHGNRQYARGSPVVSDDESDERLGQSVPESDDDTGHPLFGMKKRIRKEGDTQQRLLHLGKRNLHLQRKQLLSVASLGNPDEPDPQSGKKGETIRDLEGHSDEEEDRMSRPMTPNDESEGPYSSEADESSNNSHSPRRVSRVGKTVSSNQDGARRGVCGDGEDDTDVPSPSQQLHTVQSRIDRGRGSSRVEDRVESRIDRGSVESIIEEYASSNIGGKRDGECNDGKDSAEGE